MMEWKFPERFEKRLSMENCWSTEMTTLVIEEYLKFMSLATVSLAPVTPSEEIDQVWHLHILHMEDYSLFTKALGKQILHGPTKGGKTEDDRFFDQYSYTLDLYREIYRKDPPHEVWPLPEDRFKGSFARVDLDTHMVIKITDFPKLTKFFAFIMKIRQLLWVIMLTLTLSSYSADVPSRPSGKVWDPQDIFTQAQEHQLSEAAKIPTLDVMIVGVKSLAPYETASSYAEALYKVWKLGTQENMNGLLIVVAQSAPHSKDPRDLCRIMTGWETMKRLPDSLVIETIKHKHVMIHLPEKPFDAAIGGLKAVKEMLPTKTLVKNEKVEESVWSWVWILIGIIVLVLVISISISVWANSESSSYSSSSNYAGSSGYYSSSSSSKKKDNNSSSSGCSTSSCGSSGCGGGGCGGGGCGS